MSGVCIVKRQLDSCLLQHLTKPRVVGVCCGVRTGGRPCLYRYDLPQFTERIQNRNVMYASSMSGVHADILLHLYYDVYVHAWIYRCMCMYVHTD